MGGFFSVDGAFAKYGGKVWDLIWVNILTLIFSIPIITSGAAVAAMHYVVLKIFRDEEYGITKAFFKSFRMNLKQGIIIQTIFLLAGYFLSITLLSAWGENVDSPGPLFYMAAIVAMIVFCIWIWTMVFLSRYTNTVLNTVRQASIACLVYPVRSILMGLLGVLPFALLMFKTEVFFLVLVLGISAPAIFQALLYNDVLKRLETAAEDREEALLEAAEEAEETEEAEEN